MKCCCSAAVNTPCSTRHFGLTGFDCRVIERWINNLFLEVCRWVFVCLRSLSIFRCCLASSSDTGFTRECLAPCAGWADCACLWHSLARSIDAWSILGVFFQETVPSPSVSCESLFSPFSTFPLTGSNQVPSVFVNNLGCVCARVRVAECWLVLRGELYVHWGNEECISLKGAGGCLSGSHSLEVFVLQVNRV